MVCECAWSQLPPFAKFPVKISTIASLQAALSFLDSCVVCVGNPDERYRCLSDERIGVFMDSSGMRMLIHPLIHYCIYVQAARGMLLI